MGGNWRRSVFGILVAVTAAIGLSAGGMARAQTEDLKDWRAGPSDDAVMEIGQRFDCVGPDCPTGLSCLYALGPNRPPGSWPVTTEFMLDEEKMPWSDFEFWLVAKAKALRPVLADDPLVRSDRFARRTPATVVDLESGEYVTRSYGIVSKRNSYMLPAYFWTVKGRLAVMFCVHAPSVEVARQARPQIGALLQYLRPEESEDADES